MSNAPPDRAIGQRQCCFRFESKDRIGRAVARFYLLGTSKFEGSA
jgi:hypothetical protein